VALQYSRWLPRDMVPDAVPEVEAHVREHLAAVADPNDEPTRADEVVISHEDADDELGNDGVLVVGELDAEPDAPYLRPGFTPEQDIAANPLTVESIEEQP
jgi:hypothetical protein